MRTHVRETARLLFAAAAASTFVGAMSGCAQAAEAEEERQAAAQTMEQRLKAIESKTGFYTSSTKRVTLKYRQGQPIAQCAGKRMTIQINPRLMLGGDLYVWSSLSTSLANFPGSNRSMEMSYFVPSKPQNSCVASIIDIANVGVQQKLKLFCKFDVVPADKIIFSFTLNNDASDVDACESITAVNFDIKLLSIGVREPK